MHPHIWAARTVTDTLWACAVMGWIGYGVYLLLAWAAEVAR